MYLWNSQFLFTEIDVARWGVASQSSTLDDEAVASRAIDGDLRSEYTQGDCSSTEYSYSPWWRVDLQVTLPVTSVAITNPGGNESTRISGAEIHIGDWLGMSGLLNTRCATILTLGPGETRSFNCDGMAGRYVTVIIPSVYQYLTLCEVQVFAPPKPVVNVARRGVATQSSTYQNGIASRSIDGNLRNAFDHGFCSHTNNDYSSGWRVDLLDTYSIASVSITNRMLGNTIIADMYVGSSLESNGILNARCVQINFSEQKGTISFNCGGMAGRYVTISSATAYQYLVLCEVQVFAAPKPVTNVALNGVALQSSNYVLWSLASIANDGILASNLQLRQCSCTNLNFPAWWRVDLLATYSIASVVVTNRRDAVPERLNGAEIRIGNSLENNGIMNPRCTTIVTLNAEVTRSFNCGGMSGRYVTVSIPGRAEYLTLGEVQIFALPPDGQRLALKITAATLDGSLLDTPEKKNQTFEQIRIQIGHYLSDWAIRDMKWREDHSQWWKGLNSSTTDANTGDANCPAP
ncbi:uncharacterized protein LOC144752871 [Lissotriton helveticus]